MASRGRRLWLPALAVLLPCAFIGVLAWQWLDLEREAASQRSDRAAHLAVESMARDLSQTLVRVGMAVAHDHQPKPAALPEPISAAFVVDSAGHLIDSDTVTAATGTGDNSRAATLVAQAARALKAGDKRGVISAATQVFGCCPGSRDEYGVAYVFYAAWQRATVYSAEPRRKELDDALVDDLDAAARRDELGNASDVVQMNLLAESVGQSAAWTGAMASIEASRQKQEQRRETGRALSGFASAVADRLSSEGIVFGSVRSSGAALAALVAVDQQQRVALVVGRPALASWILRWSQANPAFDLRIADTADPAPAETARIPLVPEVPGVVIAAGAESREPGADRRRQLLFVGAAGGALVLTLLVAYLALRDVSRELRVASLRATFIAGVTHELKTPLTSIRLLAETLRQQRARPEVQLELLDTVVKETERLSEVVDNVLSSSRIESGTRTYDPRPLLLSEAVQGVLHRFDYVLAKEGFRIDAQIDDAPVWVSVDADAFGQALLNLLSNAVKYSGTSRTIAVSVTTTDGDASITVTDHGIGIPAAEHERIFQSFYRVPAAASEVAGAGLGLSLVRHFAAAHGGRVTLTSEPGKGSAFTLTLPLVPAASHAAAPVPAHG